MKLHIQPQPSQFPKTGGVRQHLELLYRQAKADSEITLVADISQADIVHVESAYPVRTTKPMVYVCHGGFLPEVLPIVVENLNKAAKIISVADWIVDQFFANHRDKTVVIPNGVDLAEFDHVPIFDDHSNYVLYGKEYGWNFNDFQSFARLLPEQLFLTTYWPMNVHIPGNVNCIGLQTSENIKTYIKNAQALMMTGSEVCPVMLLEAWAAGVPIVAKDMHGNAELMRSDGRNTVGGSLYFVPSAEVVTGVLQRKEELGSAGREKVEELYQWKDLWQRYKVVYEEVLKCY